MNDSLAKRNVAILVVAQAFLGAQMVMIFIVGGLAGQSMVSNICWATMPISMIVFSSMTTAPWLSNIMQKKGRRFGFMIGALAGGLGALVAAYAIYISSFGILLLGSYLTGIYMCAQGFFRFAAIDTASEEFRPKAISYVMAGGLVSAIVGPQLVKLTSETFVIPFVGVYLTVAIINLLGLVLIAFLKIPLPTEDTSSTKPARTRIELLKTPKIAVAIICAMVSYALMNLVMTSTPLAVIGCGFSQANAADVVMAHVLGMFAPSFFTGHLIARFGAERIVAAGLIILGIAGGVDLAGVGLGNFFVGLLLLGIGWNFGFIGATALLASSHEPSERGAVQGMNDFFVFGFVTIASLASGGLMNCSGGTAVEGWNAVNLAMIPFLAIAGGALVWLARDAKRAT